MSSLIPYFAHLRVSNTFIDVANESFRTSILFVLPEDVPDLFVNDAYPYLLLQLFDDPSDLAAISFIER